MYRHAHATLLPASSIPMMPYPQQTRESTNANSGIDAAQAGALSAVVVDFFVYPIDTLKTRMQSPEYEKRYKDPHGAVRRNVLFKGVYQGVWSVVLSTIPACMPNFDFTNYVLSVTDNGGCSRSILHNLRSSKIHPGQYLENNTRSTIKPEPE